MSGSLAPTRKPPDPKKIEVIQKEELGDAGLSYKPHAFRISMRGDTGCPGEHNLASLKTPEAEWGCDVCGKEDVPAGTDM